jgi:signal transduction histidine kinase
MCARALRRHIETGDEGTLHEAYEFGRDALAQSVGIMDMALVLWRAAVEVLPTQPADGRVARAIEEFLVESLSPFEMAHRGVREANESLRRLDQRREDHARRVARELHDQAGQLLATVFLSLEGLRPHVAPEGKERLERTIALLNQVEDEIRRVAHELRPTVLDDLGLYPALRLLVEGLGRRNGLAIEVRGSSAGRLPPRIETELYRMAQEALCNVIRHSRASRASLEIERVGNEVHFTVRDDGKGFDPAVTPAPGTRGLGLDGIRERLSPLGGVLRIHSRPGEGTELLIQIPIEVTHADANAHC